MAKNLPPLFKVSSDQVPTNTNMKYTYATTKPKDTTSLSNVTSSQNIDQALDEIFTTRGYSFNIPVEITFAGKTIQTYLATRTNHSIITLDNETIPIATITSLQIKNPIK